MKFKLTHLVLALSLLAVCPVATYAQEQEKVVEYEYKTDAGKTDELQAVLRLPSSAPNRRAVVILHDGGGWTNERTMPYAKMLAANGFVTLEPRLYARPGQWNGYNDLSKVFASLKLLAKRADVDPTNIYIMGQSAGAMLSIVAATAWANKTMNDSGAKFKAHASLYPMCWPYYASAMNNPSRRVFKDYPQDIFQAWNTVPIRIFVGTRDGFDNNDSNTCAGFVSELSDGKQKNLISIVKYENATHGWDHGETYSFYSAVACKGRGCEITNEANPEITKKGYQDVLDFMKAN